MSKFLEMRCGCTGSWGSGGKGVTRPCALHWKPGDNEECKPTPEQKRQAELWAANQRRGLNDG